MEPFMTPRVTSWRALAWVAAFVAATVAGRAQTDGAIRWSYTTGGLVLSSAAVGADGTLYFGSQDRRLYAIRPGATPGTTSLKWSFLTGDWVDAAPAVATDGTVYAASWDGKLYALRDDQSRVTKLWEYTLGAYAFSSPAIGASGTIYVGSGDSNLYAINPDGTLKWTYPVSDYIDSSPAVGPDERIYFGSWDGSLTAVSADGVLVWRVVTGGGILGSPAIAADGTVYIGSRDGKLRAIAADGTTRWEFQTGDAIESSPALGSDGTVYIGSMDGRLYAIAPDGTERWRFPATGQTALQPLQSPPAVRADGMIVFGSSNNAIYAVRPNGTQAWRTVVGDWIDASPLIAGDGAIYVGSYDRKLYALNSTSGPAATDWPQFQRDPARTSRQPLGVAAGGTGRLSNLSVRSLAGQGAETLIVGFVAGGNGSKRVLVRGVGPTLGQAPFNVAGVVADPVLRLYDDGVLRTENDDWSTGAGASGISATAAQVGAFPLPNPSKDAALVADLEAKGYTAHVTGNAGGVGVALVEAYDAGGTGTARLRNVSARSRVGTGGDILIAGFVVVEGRQTLLIRGPGPTLGAAPFNVPGALADPQLRIFRAATVVAENDDWSKASNASQIAALAAQVGAFALQTGGRDPAMVVTLPPGAYTAQISGVGATTGVALIEVYEVR
jgi:outer membrane protein assembly factor BamB